MIIVDVGKRKYFRAPRANESAINNGRTISVKARFWAIFQTGRSSAASDHFVSFRRRDCRGVHPRDNALGRALLGPATRRQYLLRERSECKRVACPRVDRRHRNKHRHIPERAGLGIQSEGGQSNFSAARLRLHHWSHLDRVAAAPLVSERRTSFCLSTSAAAVQPGRSADGIGHLSRNAGGRRWTSTLSGGPAFGTVHRLEPGRFRLGNRASDHHLYVPWRNAGGDLDRSNPVSYLHVWSWCRIVFHSSPNPRRGRCIYGRWSVVEKV